MKTIIQLSVPFDFEVEQQTETLFIASKTKINHSYDKPKTIYYRTNDMDSA